MGQPKVPFQLDLIHINRFKTEDYPQKKCIPVYSEPFLPKYVKDTNISFHTNHGWGKPNLQGLSRPETK